MKNLVLALGIFLIAFSVKAQEKTVTLKVTLENVMNDNGNVLASLHTNETFMKGAGIVNLAEKAKKGSISFTIENVKPGSYAIMVLHDENNNQRMDYEANGMPKENYGMSNNEMTMGPPTFADAKFEVADEDLELTIRF
ncbi:DUF2141 domain-containing protein [Croceitalea sp. MTPC9]|uniref:DUF2141 domain-containing protein n=1 Tax=unclassified Croceitalea TaxID=2632280 RepID=UPI002B36537A|nr:DUF2141 domain-containing protein [Croceitalea sp. MTPC6]GMN15312.1 DUF2141 domain-containing protein [Croceitalea sp. MTPC9]